MNEERAKKIFEKYNPAVDVVRCPNGRAIVRKQLDSYARAAVNLYGIISRDEFVEIFSGQNSDQTSEDEIYTLLLPLVLKSGWYCFYKDNIVHYCFFDDFDQADYLLKYQADKPRYVPQKDEFLKYIDEDYTDNDHLWNVLRFMRDAFGYDKDTTQAYEEIKNYIIFDDVVKKLGSILDEYNFLCSDEDQVQELINLIMVAKNNTRIWENKGYKPDELMEIMRKRNENVVKFPTVQKMEQVGRNEPCPCGSGKKYKKCCAVFGEAKTAQLSTGECRLFYETWYGLLGYVNERKGVIKAKIKTEYPNRVNDMLIHKVREVLWENPDLIDEYIDNADLPQEKIDILKLWRTSHKKGTFFLLEYHLEYAVMLASNEQGEDRLYGVKGISNPIANIMRRDLPVPVETVLLPFKGKIIYDSLMGSMQIGFAEGAKASFRRMYDRALKHGIITSLE